MISISIRTIIIYLLLSIMLKMMGKRQLGELEVNELVSTLLISEIAAIPISDTNTALLPSVIPILFIASFEVVISVIKNRCASVKQIVEGEPVYIIYKGRLNQKALLENRISINELLTEMRTQSIGDIKNIRYGILEQNGKFSLLKNDDSDTITSALIIDSVPNIKILEEEGLDESWLKSELKKRSLCLNDILLMTLAEDGTIDIIERDNI